MRMILRQALGTRSSIRDLIAKRASGGPPFRLMPNEVLVEVEDPERVLFDGRTVEMKRMQPVEGILNDLGFQTERLNNVGVIVAETDNLADIVNRFQEFKNTFDPEIVDRIQSVESRTTSFERRTVIGSRIFGGMEFGQEPGGLEEEIRSKLSSLNLKNPMTEAIQQIDGVINAEINFTRNTFGPRNLNVNVDALPDLLQQPQEENGDTTLADATEKFGVQDAWNTTRGSGAIVAVLDTSFCREFLESDRVIDTFSGPNVDNAWSAPEEGHGTMTAYAAAGSAEESGLDWDGVAPEADLLLARVSGSDGALKHVNRAMDWLAGHVRELDRPVISNHSYGVPLCSANQMDLCDSTSTKLARALNQREDHQGFYAAGNEALYCGHRVSGVTNGINGINSDPSSITVGALRFDLNDAQNYSSHGWGTCSGLDTDPKPDVSCLLPSIIPYACSVRDMSGSTPGSSNGGTSLATPLVCGSAALLTSVNGDASTDTLESILQDTARLPRITQFNILRGHDARFGNGQIRVDEAISQI